VITPDEVVAEHGADALRGYGCSSAATFFADRAMEHSGRTGRTTLAGSGMAKIVLLRPEDDPGKVVWRIQRSPPKQRLTHQTIPEIERDLVGTSSNTR